MRPATMCAGILNNKWCTLFSAPSTFIELLQEIHFHVKENHGRTSLSRLVDETIIVRRLKALDGVCNHLERKKAHRKIVGLRWYFSECREITIIYFCHACSLH